jgi:regulator of sirC expression with transglutaminase-like and TPR domain
MDFSLARQRFYQEIQQPEEAIALAQAALYLAQEEYPDLDSDRYLNQLDRMATEVADRLPTERYPLRVIQTINQYLYQDLGFRGNTDDYYDPRNSYLNQVIDRRTGIPITLSLVYLEIAQRVGFPMVGVGMPGHFLIRPALDEMEVFVDPFHQGEVLFAEDCQERLSQIYGRPVPLRPEFLKSITAHQFLARMLSNLKVIYLNQGEMVKTLATIDRILLLFPDAPVEHRDRGLLHYQMKRWNEATEDLQYYLTQTPTAEDAPIIRQMIKQISENKT